MARALLAVVLYAWWWFVRKPRHHSYPHACWRMWQEQQHFRRFLRGE